MSSLNNFWIGALATLGLVAATGAGVLYSGIVDVSADTPHSPLVYHLLETARERAIARRTSGIMPPADLDDAERQRRGSGNYAAMCADCHLKPGVENSEIRQGLYPTPPDLTRSATASPGAARRFWIIKHGIKASGMPAWSKGGMEDEVIWDLVSFLNRLPILSPDQYDALVAASDGHVHGGRTDQEAMPVKGGGHDHSTHDH